MKISDFIHVCPTLILFSYIPEFFYQKLLTPSQLVDKTALLTQFSSFWGHFWGIKTTHLKLLKMQWLWTSLKGKGEKGEKCGLCFVKWYTFSY